MELRMQLMDYMKGNTPVQADAIQFVAEDGRVMFEVRAVNSRSIEVRACDCCKVGETLYSTHLELLPKASNVAQVKVMPYDEE